MKSDQCGIHEVRIATRQGGQQLQSNPIGIFRPRVDAERVSGKPPTRLQKQELGQASRLDFRRFSVVLKLEQVMTQEAIERFAVGAGHGVLIEIS